LPGERVKPVFGTVWDENLSQVLACVQQHHQQQHQPEDQSGSDFNDFHLNSTSVIQPLISVCSPLGANVSQSITDKIVRGDFVDFGALLDPLYDSSNSQSDGMALRVDASGQISFKEARQSRRITSIHGWTSAFFVFCAIYLRAHPSRTQELLKYGYLVREAASKFGGWGWRDYDIQFRLRQRSHPQNSWAIIDGELS
jgi:hypothetical protein